MKKEMAKYYSRELAEEVIEEVKEELELLDKDIKDISTIDLNVLAYQLGQLDALNGKKDIDRRNEIKDEFENRKDIPSWMELKDISRNFGSGMKDARKAVSNMLYGRE